MLTVLVAHPPRFGGKVRSFNDRATRQVRGVVGVVEIPQGVAVIAESFWPAKKGRDALKVQWDDSAAETRGSEELFRTYRQQADQPGLVAHSPGDTKGALANGAKLVEAIYEFPYLAHAPMEPDDCVIQKSGDRCRMRFGSQLQTSTSR